MWSPDQDSKVIDAVPLNLFSHKYCDKHSVYSDSQTTLNENQLCAGLPSKNNQVAPFSGKHIEDFGGPLICLNKTNQQPIFTGVASSNSLSTKSGHPGIYTNIFKNNDWIRNFTGKILTPWNSIFLSSIFQGKSASWVSFEMISKSFKSELVRFKFHPLG